MAGIPMRFKRVTAPLDEGARERLCQSSGSERSPENSLELADLVDSFFERQGGIEDDGGGEKRDEDEEEMLGSEKSCSRSSDPDDVHETLESLLAADDEDGNRRRIRAEVEAAVRSLRTAATAASAVGFKRKLMGLLRERGLDAGLCKSRWEKTRRFPEGEYEYIDVVVVDGEGGGGGKQRYVVELELAAEFGIARPTPHYAALLGLFPAIFVGRWEELKQVVRLMCEAAKESMKRREMHVPPWRRNGYMMGKWFGSYKRTTKTTTKKKNVGWLRKAEEEEEEDGGTKKMRAVGFVIEKGKKNCSCREEMMGGLRVGNLAVAFNEAMHSQS
ncbi:hypothetical protein ACLOJK_034066 [Asimina triloba]